MCTSFPSIAYCHFNSQAMLKAINDVCLGMTVCCSLSIRKPTLTTLLNYRFRTRTDLAVPCLPMYYCIHLRRPVPNMHSQGRQERPLSSDGDLLVRDVTHVSVCSGLSLAHQKTNTDISPEP